jgi:predicted permease
MKLRHLLGGLRGLFRRDELDRELDDELKDFAARAAAEHERRGLAATDALRAANAEVGSVTAVKDEIRAGLWEWSVATFWRDVRHGARQLRRTPGFATVAILTLGLGLGTTTAIVSVADAVLFRPLPVSNPQDLVLFGWNAPPRGMPVISIAGMNIDAVTGQSSSTAFSHRALQRFAAETRTLTEVFAFATAVGAPSAPGLNDGARGQLVTGNYFRALGVPPALGRLLTPADDRPDAPLVTVLGYRYWRRAFGGDPAAIGRTLRFRRAVGTPSGERPAGFTDALATIVGVTPPEFTGTGQLGDAPDFFLALLPGAPVSSNKFAGRMATTWVWPFRIMGRLEPGSTIEDARRELEPAFLGAVADATAKKPQAGGGATATDAPRLTVTSGSQGLLSSRESLTRPIGILTLIVVVLLTIVSVNLANLLLARGEARRVEMAIRLAIGAPRGRLVRQLVTEALLITACGALAGLLVARWAKDAALAWLTRTTPAFVVEPSLDAKVLAVSAGIALIVTLVVALIPAIRSTRVDAQPALKDGARSVAPARNVFGQSLVVVQVALALVLVVTAGLFVRTLRNLQTADVGFNTSDLVLLQVHRTTPPPAPREAGWIDATFALDRLADRLQTIPGVRSAAFSYSSLLGGDLAMPYLTVPGQPRASGEDRTVYTQAVSPGFFATMEMPIVLGRALERGDRGAPVGVINETLARRFFPGASGVGRRVGITKNAEAPEVADANLIEIVGVVRDAKYMTIREQTLPTVFTPRVEPNEAAFAVRTGVDAGTLATAMRDVVREFPDFVATDFRTQAEQAALTFAEERHFAMLSSLFGGVALILTAIGVYGLLSYRVARRTREIGIRMALGARRSDVIRRVMRETLLVVGAGVAIGALASVAVTRALQHQLFGLAPTDAVAMGAAVALILAAALVAAALPARRAARVDPLVALRMD